MFRWWITPNWSAIRCSLRGSRALNLSLSFCCADQPVVFTRLVSLPVGICRRGCPGRIRKKFLFCGLEKRMEGIIYWIGQAKLAFMLSF